MKRFLKKKKKETEQSKRKELIVYVLTEVFR